MWRAIGSFACSDELVNSIHRNVVWGLRGGLVGIPTDCPQRDERLGWTADAAAMAPSALFLGDTAACLREVARRPVRCPARLGGVSRRAPRGSASPAPATPAGRTRACCFRGRLPADRERRVVERQYDSMLGTSGSSRPTTSGACATAVGTATGWRSRTPTSLELIGTAYLARRPPQLFVRMARLLGRDADAEAMAGSRHERRPPSGVGSPLRPARSTKRPRRAMPSRSGSTSCRAGPAHGRRPPGEPDRGGRRPSPDRVPGHGTRPACAVRPRHHELATQVVRQDTYPGWGYEVRQGATTIWERWNSWTPEDGFADPSMNSLNHAALGSVAGWLHEHLAGLAPGRPAIERCSCDRGRPPGSIGPGPTHESAHGRSAVEWMADARSLEITLEVPPNTFADVVIPGEGGRSGSTAHARGRGPTASFASRDPCGTACPAELGTTRRRGRALTCPPRPDGGRALGAPGPADRAARSEAVERRIRNAAIRIADPGLRRLLEGTLPNTLDTTIVAGGSDEHPTRSS